MNVKVNLSGSLRAIIEHKPAETMVEIAEPISIKELLVLMGINQLVVTIVLVNGTAQGKDFRIEQDAEITLFGPVAGG